MVYKAKERFMQKAEEIEIIFRPQCLECIYNIGLDTCEQFKTKPNKYKNNENKCPKIKIK